MLERQRTKGDPEGERWKTQNGLRFDSLEANPCGKYPYLSENIMLSGNSAQTTERPTRSVKSNCEHNCLHECAPWDTSKCISKAAALILKIKEEKKKELGERCTDISDRHINDGLIRLEKLLQEQ